MAPTVRPGGAAENAIIEKLFSLGLDLNTALRLLRDEPTAALLHEAADLLESAIRRIRDQALDHHLQQRPQPWCQNELAVPIQ